MAVELLGCSLALLPTARGWALVTAFFLAAGLYGFPAFCALRWMAQFLYGCPPQAACSSRSSSARGSLAQPSRGRQVAVDVGRNQPALRFQLSCEVLQVVLSVLAATQQRQ